MVSDFHSRLSENINLKKTNELLDIWKKNDRVEWSDDAFIVIEEILRERIDELPSQNEPIYVYQQEKSVKAVPGFEYLLDDTNPPEFYQPYEVLRLYGWINKGAKAYIVILAISSLIAIPGAHQFFNNLKMIPIHGIWSWFLAIVTALMGVTLQCVLTYFPLKALASILKILMEMEFRSRGAVKQMT
jgi:hypothetical protein